MPSDNRWREDERYPRNEGPRTSYRGDPGRYGREYGESYGAYGQGQDEGGGEFRGGHGGHYRGGQERDAWRRDQGRHEQGRGEYGALDYGRDYGAPPYRGYGTREGFGRDRGRSAYSGHDRDWMDKATDEVSSWFGNEDAERRRQMDMLQDNHRGRGPKGYTRSDERVREDVCDRLADDPVVDASEVEVSVASCEVTLTGTVGSREERRRAEDCAERVLGVTHVQNNLRVAQAGGAGSMGGTTATGSSGAMSPGSSSRTGRAGEGTGSRAN